MKILFAAILVCWIAVQKSTAQETDSLKKAPPPSFLFQNLSENAVQRGSEEWKGGLAVQEKRKEIVQSTLILYQEKFYSFQKFMKNLPKKRDLQFSVIKGDSIRYYTDKNIERIIVVK